jgi:predicted transport protein
MAKKTLAQKLAINPSMRTHLINAPSSFVESLVASLPEDSQEFDVVLLFSEQHAQLEAYLLVAQARLAPGGMLWIAYPKKTGAIRSDLDRDVVWRIVEPTGFQAVMQVSLDDTWSALRFKPATLPSGEALVDWHFSGEKATLRPIYNRLLESIRALGADVRTEPRQSYIAFARKIHFAIIIPSTRSRLDLGLRLSGMESGGRLQAAGSFGSGSVTHRVALTDPGQVDQELQGWLRTAYDTAK